MMIDKQTLRKQIRAAKRSFLTATSEQEQRQISGNLLHKVEQLPQFRAARVVLAYHSLPDEVFTHDILDEWARTKVVLLPKVVGDSLTLHRYQRGSDLAVGAFDILEPITPEWRDYAAVDFVLVPGVAFDSDGNRLGRGKGYYDRLFAELLPPDVFKVGLCYPFQLVDSVPVEPRDVRMSLVVAN